VSWRWFHETKWRRIGIGFAIDWNEEVAFAIGPFIFGWENWSGDLTVYHDEGE
jgi:hypothetical protein